MLRSCFRKLWHLFAGKIDQFVWQPRACEDKRSEQQHGPDKDEKCYLRPCDKELQFERVDEENAAQKPIENWVLSDERNNVFARVFHVVHDQQESADEYRSEEYISHAAPEDDWITDGVVCDKSEIDHVSENEEW